MLGITSNKDSEIITQIRDILAVDVEPDGLDFDSGSIKSERITEDADYECVSDSKEIWKRLNQEHVPKKFNDIVMAVNEFLSPAIFYLSSEKLNPEKWKAPGPWKQ